MDNLNFSETIYNCAIACVLKRKQRKCKERFSSSACNDCKLNINKYFETDSKYLDLYMLQAESRVCELNYSNKMDKFFFRFVIIITIIACLGFFADSEVQQKLKSWYNYFISTTSVTNNCCETGCGCKK